MRIGRHGFIVLKIRHCSSRLAFLRIIQRSSFHRGLQSIQGVTLPLLDGSRPVFSFMDADYCIYRNIEFKKDGVSLSLIADLILALMRSVIDQLQHSRRLAGRSERYVSSSQIIFDDFRGIG